VKLLGLDGLVTTEEREGREGLISDLRPRPRGFLAKYLSTWELGRLENAVDEGRG